MHASFIKTGQKRYATPRELAASSHEEKNGRQLVKKDLHGSLGTVLRQTLK
jgi:hypothetical protein